MTSMHSPASAGRSFVGIRKRAVLLATVASLMTAFAGPALAEDNTLRLMTFNIWDKFKQYPEAPAQLLIPGNYDAVSFQEVNGSRYVTQLPGMLEAAGLGKYTGTQSGSSGIISRLEGSVGSYTLPGIGTQGRNLTYAIADAKAGRPTTTIGSIHMDYSDSSTNRVKEAKALSNWAKQQTGPLIMGGDFNSGDVAERGLHSVSQQELLLRTYTNSPNNSFYYNLLTQYATDKTALDNFIATNRGKGSAAIKAAKVPEGLFKPETSPVQGNTPVTMNVLKKQFMMLQTDAEREGFAPHELGDGSTTWPSVGEDATNTWASWDRAKIDHFLASRPFGKWFAITDDPADKYLGIVDKVYVTDANGNRRPLSDHDLDAHEFTWVGPKLETFSQTADGQTKDATRLVWGEGASQFEEKGKVFELSRNNMRTDVYLGQISDADGNPTLNWLTDAEKKTLLDCASTDSRLAGAIAEYCIDDHSFIAETLVKDGGTVVVTEDAALGSASADLRLTGNSGLRIAGTAMDTLGRDISLEGEGGFVEVADAAGEVTATGVISGDGALTKRGEGILRLTAENTYTGETTVESGTLLVNGSNTSSPVISVLDRATLGGVGRVGNVFLDENSILSPGDFGIGTLFVDGDLTAASSLLNLEIGKNGFDMLKVAGDFNVMSSFTISVSFLDAFLPAKGDFFEFLTVAGLSDGVLGLTSLLLPEGDQYAGLSVFGNKGRFALGWTNPYEVAPVPLPAPVLMMLSAFGLLGLFRARRQAAGAA